MNGCTFSLILFLIGVCAAALRAGPVGYWNFEQVTGTTVPDGSGNGFDGQLTGAAAMVMEGSNAALALTGDGTYVQIEPHVDLSPTDQITVALWFKVEQFDAGWQSLITRGDSGWRIRRHDNASYLSFACGVTPPYRNLAGHTAVDDGQWHHVGLVNDGVEMVLYLDGRVETSASVLQVVPVAANAQPIRIGGNAEQPSRDFKGRIDDVILFDIALGPDAMARLYAEGVQAVTDYRHSPEEEAFYNKVREMNALLVAGDAVAAASAIVVYQGMLEAYPERAAASSLRLKRGLAYEQSGDPVAARSVYLEVADQAAGADEAVEAAGRVGRLAGDDVSFLAGWLPRYTNEDTARHRIYSSLEGQIEQFKQEKHSQQAMAICQTVADAWPDTPEGCGAQGELILFQLDSGNLATAEQGLQVLLASPCDAPAAIANTLLETAKRLAGDYQQADKALGLLQIVTDRWGTERFALWSHQWIASLYIKQEDFTAAQERIDLINALQASHPAYSFALLGLGSDYETVGQIAKARECYRLAAEHPSRHKAAGQARLKLIQLGIEQSDFTDFDELLNQYIQNPELEGQLLTVAKYCERTGKYDAALQVYDAVLQHSADIAAVVAAWRQIIAVQSKTGRDDQLDLTLDRLIAALPEIGQAHIGTIRQIASNDLIWRDKKPAAAQKLHHALLAQWPDDPEAVYARHGLILAAISRGDDATAQALTDQLAADYPNHSRLPRVFSWLANDYNQFNRPDKALQMYQYVVDTWPNGRYTTDAQKQIMVIKWRMQQAVEGQYTAQNLLAGYADDPALGDLLLWYGDFMKEAGQYDRALPFYEEAAAHARTAAAALRAWTQLAVLYIRAGQNDQVRPIVETIACHYADVAGWEQAIGQVEEAYQQYGNVTDIEEVYQTVFATCPLDDQALWAQSRSVGLHLSHYQTDQVPEEFASLLSTFANNPRLPDQVLALGREASSSGNHDLALEFYQNILDHFPNDPHVVDAWQGKLLSLAAVEDVPMLDEAVGTLLAGAIPPRRAAVILNDLAAACVQRQDKALATELYNRVVTQLPDQATEVVRAQEQLTLLNIQLADGETAESAIARISEDYPNFRQLPAVFNRLGQEFLDQHQPDQARTLYLHVLDMQPPPDQALWAQQGLAQAAMAAGQPDAFRTALATLRETYREHPTVTTALMQLADACERRRDPNAAEQVYQTITQTWPDHDDAVVAELSIALLAMVHEDQAKGQAAFEAVIDHYQDRADLPQRLVRFLEKRMKNSIGPIETPGLLHVCNLVINRFLPCKPDWVRDDVYVAKPYCLFRMRRYQEALDFSEWVLTEHPQFRYSSYLEALEGDCLRIMLVQQPPDPQTTSEKGVRMEAHYQRVLETYRGPSYYRDAIRKRAGRHLGLYYYDRGQWNEAARYLELALPDGDGVVERQILPKLADAYDHLGQTERAAELQQRYLDYFENTN